MFLDKETLQHYTEEHRYYHNIHHIDDCLDKAEEIINHSDKNIDKQIIDLAIFYHDVIYDPIKQDNEDLSATYGLPRLISILPNDINKVNIICNIIRNTKHHSNPTSFEEAIVFDADMSILSSHQCDYSYYMNNVREEYNMFDNETYQQGRLIFINKTLNSKRIYFTDYAYDNWENKARENLSWEKSLLIDLLG